MELKFKIDTREESVAISTPLIAELVPSDLPEGLDQAAIVKESIEHPIGSKPLEEIISKKDTIAIITSDITRPLPSYTVLPPLLDKLSLIGVAKENITIVIALGSHRPQNEEELRHLVSDEVFENYTVINSGNEGFTNVGKTKRGTPVDIDKTVMNADKRICLGNVEYHYFAGYSGGAKAIMPGCSTYKAIEKNHRFMVEEAAMAGKIIGNPVREDIEEAASLVGVDFIVNVVLNTKKEVIYCASGDVTEAHRDACRYLSDCYLSVIPERADIVIVSQAGAPKDMNLYQTQKALDNAKHAVKAGGIVILVGSCKEGFGNASFAQWMCKYTDPQEMVDALFKTFQLGAHKAASIAMVQKNAKIFLVSDMEDEIVNKTFLTPYHSIQQAYDDAVKELGKDATVIAMPYGGSTLPFVQ